MSSEEAAQKQTLAPDYLAHWVVKTARPQEMIAWYGTVFGAHIVHEDSKLVFLTWDDESHRLAMVKLPRVLRYLFPFSRMRRKIYGVDHIGFTFTSLERLRNGTDLAELLRQGAGTRPGTSARINKRAITWKSL
jgi:hypothetical protein